ncbi:MAG: hypothetical protein R3250_02265 [Melioribacteraceae bacterium]|nr:hypothetical protein [Melioribacteraceae bacterium]
MKVACFVILTILSIVPGAVCGAILGAIYAPAKLWALLFGGGEGSTPTPNYVDDI